MKLLKILHHWQIQFQVKKLTNDLYARLLNAFWVLGLVSILVWFVGPYLSYANIPLLSSADKRLYIILFCCLAWLLKFLILDLKTATFNANKDPQVQKKLYAMQTRFFSVAQFLQKNRITRLGKKIPLKHLPCFLLMGPKESGKTTLLLKSQVNFVLKRQAKETTKDSDINPSEHCDWWITKEASLIDVPGEYLSLKPYKKNTEPSRFATHLWRNFLTIVKKQRGKSGIDGIILALPLPEVMQLAEPKRYQQMLRGLLQRLYDIQNIFQRELPLYLIITKSDLLPGFSEFFAESAAEEITQAWGINFSTATQTNDMAFFTERFNALIKKLNSQLLWRLHHEHNPMLRPYIKDFPLQVERLKEVITDFLRKALHAQNRLTLQGVYLTSSLQETKPLGPVSDVEINTQQREVQIFSNPTLLPRPYFIKQLIAHGFERGKRPKRSFANKLMLGLTYSVCASLVTVAILFFGKNFQDGAHYTQTVQQHIADYNLAMQSARQPGERIFLITNLLNQLNNAGKDPNAAFNLDYILSFYTHKSRTQAAAIYQQALHTLLAQEIKLQFEEYLKTPVNRNTDTVYGVLKSYLMLGYPKYFQAEFIFNTLHETLPNKLNRIIAQQFLQHASTLLSSPMQAVPLSPAAIEQTRQYLTALPSLQLAYVILKNNNNNNTENRINLGTNPNNVFISRQVSAEVPYMFTARSFPNILTQEIFIAAQEAAVGNWVLGGVANTEPVTVANSVAEDLRDAYINNYIDVWESLLANIQLVNPRNLQQLDEMIVTLIGNNSPLLQLLQTFYDNTYFDPIASSSPKLQNLSMLADKRQNVSPLYQIFVGLNGLHEYLQSVISARDSHKAAFYAVSKRMQGKNQDALTQLLIIADKAPDPVKFWLNKISNHAWYFLMLDAGQYLDTSWNKQVYQPYQNDIANRYPFMVATKNEVSLDNFANFFGKPGILHDFYNKYLLTMVDTANSDWRWKTLDNIHTPFNPEILKQLQQAQLIHRIFFPNKDDKLSMQFALQPYEMGKQVKGVKLKVNGKAIVDETEGSYLTHNIGWPSAQPLKKLSIQLLMKNNRVYNRDFPGNWAWFKLVNESFETAVNKKELLINFSLNENTAKYLLFTETKLNPFLTVDLKRFNLPEKLLIAKA